MIVRLIHARLLDPTETEERIGSLGIVDGRIEAAEHPALRKAPTWDLDGRYVAPAFIDLHVHFREPGMEAAETIVTGVAAAAAGGFQAVVTMPNTVPAMDRPELITAQCRRAREAGRVQVWPCGCLTVGRMGTELAPYEELIRAGAVAFSDDGRTVADPRVMEAAMRKLAELDRPVLDHAQDPAAEHLGVLHDGAVARRLGLPGIPAEAELRVVERDIDIVQRTGCRLHIQHLSVGASVERVREAQRRGLPVTAEATPHHLALCEEDLPGADPNFKMNPPLRTRADRDALIAGVVDGTISCLATDHAPHTAESKASGFEAAPFGVVGLETAIAVTWEVLVATGRMSPLEWVRRWTVGPAAVLGRPAPSLRPGSPAHIVVVDSNANWTVDPERFRSRSRNTPFAGRRFRAWPVAVCLNGVWVKGGPS